MSRNPAEICAFLKQHLASGDAVRAVTPMSEGHSNETYSVEGINAILRLPSSEAALLDGHDMLAQFQIYAVLGNMAGAPPVPRVTYYCEDEKFLGAPFFLMEKLPGVPYPDYEVPDWLASPPDAFRDELMCNYVGAFAELHRLPVADVLGRSVDPLDELERWRRFAVLADNGDLVTSFDQLKAIRPQRSGEPTIVHGDCKAANILWDENRVRAVLDWEMAFNGEPLTDLGYMLFFFPSGAHDAQPSFTIPGIWQRDRIISYWEEHTGRSAQGIEWYEALGAGKIAAILSYGHHLALTGQNGDPRMVEWEPHIELTSKVTRRLVELCE